ncbi:MAG: pyruvate ferredoxin oxidoreductase [Thermoprotei archaeon]|nr:MAG: pyruvate ferredoxin oxidoreductase [Thermoprotei archaeon]RLE99839.1 MAG: pyruvate ferredoxin oxidoreductase [Thermoprotei archaeon]
MGKVVGLMGDEAVAQAVRQSNVDVIAAYPITPQTIIVERLSEYVANGELDAAFVPVESEHSALSCCVGASLTGARVFTASAANGIALMFEITFIASSMRCPIVMAIVNRAFSAPINIHCSHDDTVALRDASWVHLISESVQEAYDNTVQAFKIAEDPRVLLPTSISLDGFILSHCLERIEMLDDEVVSEFLPPRKAEYKLDPEKPITFGPLALYDYYFEFKRQQEEAMRNALTVVKEVAKKYEEISGRKYGTIKKFMTDDADVVLVCMGSAAGTARVVAKSLRKEGKKVGVLSVRLFRPFPTEDVRETLENAKAVAVIDRSSAPGCVGGPLFEDICTALYDLPERPLTYNIIAGLGGRDITPDQIKQMYNIGFKYIEKGKVEDKVLWIGVR